MNTNSRDQVGISYLTMQNIETDKISPPVVLLAQIAARLNYPIADFLMEEKKSILHVKAEQQNVIDTKKIILKLVAPRGIVDENISIVHGKAAKGKFVSRHRHPGFELAYAGGQLPATAPFHLSREFSHLPDPTLPNRAFLHHCCVVALFHSYPFSGSEKAGRGIGVFSTE